MPSALASFPAVRMRRLRQQAKLRDLIRETDVRVNDLILPLFIRHGEGCRNPITSLPGHYQLSIDQLASEIQSITQLGIPGVMLFGIPEIKDATGSDAYHSDGIIQRAIRTIKSLAPELLVITDVCFCEYTDHGHCGVVHERPAHRDVDNDATLTLLAKQAISHAQAGADIVAPSGMMDGMIQAIRTALDEANFNHLPILSYAAKYASAFYEPFREAAEGAPKFGDRRTYQMDPANGNEALRETALDIAEGADMLLVKPAHTYLDVIYRIKQAHPGVPIAAYHVSGEFAMIKAAAANGWVNERKSVLEVLTAIKRAGADFIVTYFAKEVASWLE
ncbi:MAG: porphobilinogen synthase [Gammaproteobacteria bacterium]